MNLSENLRKGLAQAQEIYFVEQYLEGTVFGEWKTANRINIKIMEMNNGHLRNAIDLCKRKNVIDHPKYEELLAEADRRGWNNTPGSDFILDGAL
jgi:hypothetical protein